VENSIYFNPDPHEFRISRETKISELSMNKGQIKTFTIDIQLVRNPLRSPDVMCVWRVGKAPPDVMCVWRVGKAPPDVMCVWRVGKAPPDVMCAWRVGKAPPDVMCVWRLVKAPPDVMLSAFPTRCDVCLESGDGATRLCGMLRGIF
jgi:hypothetical protein